MLEKLHTHYLAAPGSAYASSDESRMCFPRIPATHLPFFFDSVEPHTVLLLNSGLVEVDSFRVDGSWMVRSRIDSATARGLELEGVSAWPAPAAVNVLVPKWIGAGQEA